MATVSNDLRERLLSYVRHQVAKGPDGIREAVQKGHDQILELIDGLSDEQAKFKSGPDDWCVLELLRHVEESKRGTARRCVQLARGEHPPAIEVVGTIEQPPFASVAEARAALDGAHRALLDFVASISPETDVESTSAHPSFGPLNCLEWAVFERVHEGDHVNQIEQIKARA